METPTPATEKPKTGFKVFNADFTCLGYQFSENSEHKIKGKPKICETGFHFCPKAVDCFIYYQFTDSNIVCEIEVLGDLDTEEGGDKWCTNHIRIGKRLSWFEVLSIVNMGRSNTGKANTGDRNTGDQNTGHWNTGDRNTGDRNTGDQNTGHWNTGDWNTGDRNTGHWNTGDWNTGDRNTGNRNTGHWNTGDWNTGDRNTGHWNTGDWNTGDRNTGNRNTGHWNTGDWNTGHWNTGDWNTGNRNTGNRNTGHWNTGHWNTGHRNTGDQNTGNRNTGHWNTGNDSTGIFCTDPNPAVYFFNKPSDWTTQQFRDSEANYIRQQVKLTEWVWWSQMSATEREAMPRAETQDGYLKVYDWHEAHKTWWDSLDDRQRSVITSLPNFDKSIFASVTGIQI